MQRRRPAPGATRRKTADDHDFLPTGNVFGASRQQRHASSFCPRCPWEIHELLVESCLIISYKSEWAGVIGTWTVERRCVILGVWMYGIVLYLWRQGDFGLWFESSWNFGTWKIRLICIICTSVWVSRIGTGRTQVSKSYLDCHTRKFVSLLLFIMNHENESWRQNLYMSVGVMKD